MLYLILFVLDVNLLLLVLHLRSLLHLILHGILYTYVVHPMLLLCTLFFSSFAVLKYSL